MAANTLLVDGQDLRDIDGLLIAGDMNLYAPGARKGDDIDLPYRRGSIAVTGLQYAAYTFSIPVIVKGADRAERETIVRGLGTLFAGTDGLVTLERRMDNGAGYDAHTAAGRFIDGLAFSLLNDRTAQTELQFKNLDGAWSPDGGTTWLVP